MELIERYLQAVKFWLPKEQRQDIIAELSGLRPCITTPPLCSMFLFQE
jgi:hypothetical protein